MSTNKPSNDQPDKASDFDDELGVPAYKPTNDSTPASASPASASPASAKPASSSREAAASKSSAAASSATTAGVAGGAASGAASGASAKAGTSPSDEPTTSFPRPKDADIKASTANKAGSQRAGGARIVENVAPVSAQPSAPALKAKQQGQPAAAAAGAQSASTQSAPAQSKPAQPTTEQAAPKRTAPEQPAQAEAAGESQRSSVFDRPGRAQPQEITPNNTQAPQSPVESQPRETMNMGPTTGSQNNSYDDRDFASRNASFEEEPTTVTPAADYGYEPTIRAAGRVACWRCGELRCSRSRCGRGRRSWSGNGVDAAF